MRARWVRHMPAQRAGRKEAMMQIRDVMTREVEVIHPDATVGSHCYLGPGSVVDRDAEVGAGTWVSAGAVVGAGAHIGARVVLGSNSSVERKASVQTDVRVSTLDHVSREGA